MTTASPGSLLALLRALTAAEVQETRYLRATHVSMLHQARAVVAAHRTVVGVGISEKARDGQGVGDLSVCFYVRRKLPLRKLRGDKVVPTVLFSEKGRVFATDVKEIGELRLHHATQAGIRSGASVSRHGDPAGTIGALVRKGGKLCILSNAHVLARSGRARIGDPVISPGTTDGGQHPRDHVARLLEFVPLQKSGENFVDAAIAEVLGDHLDDVHTPIPGVALPVRMTLAKRGMKVTKLGKSSSSTQSRVVDVNFRTVLPYPAGVGLLRFADQILCEPFAASGDSGAVVVDVETRRIVGLHFSGSDAASVCNPIGRVASALGFSF